MTSHGTITFPAGTLLYYASIEKLTALPNRPVVRLGLHPFDVYTPLICGEKYIVVVELIKPVTVCFMVNHIRCFNLYSTFKQPRAYLTDQLGGFDGWFSSGYKPYKSEVALVNLPAVAQFVSCDMVVYDWTSSRAVNDTMVPADWGYVYPITCKTLRAVCRFEEHMKVMIEKYIAYMMSDDPCGTTFYILLENAEVVYY